MIDKWLEESFDESESEIEVSDDSDRFLRDESDTRTIDSVAPDQFLINSAGLAGILRC